MGLSLCFRSNMQLKTKPFLTVLTVYAIPVDLGKIETVSIIDFLCDLNLTIFFGDISPVSSRFNTDSTCS